MHGHAPDPWYLLLKFFKRVFFGIPRQTDISPPQQNLQIWMTSLNLDDPPKFEWPPISVWPPNLNDPPNLNAKLQKILYRLRSTYFVFVSALLSVFNNRPWGCGKRTHHTDIWLSTANFIAVKIFNLPKCSVDSQNSSTSSTWQPSFGEVHRGWQY